MPPPSTAHDVEQRLLRIVQRVLRRDRVDAERALADQGADSLAVIQIIAGVLTEFDVGLTTEAVLAAESVAELRSLILERRAQPGPPRAPFLASADAAVDVPPLANRFSYLLRRQRNLQYWHVSTGVLIPTRSIEADALAEAVFGLVSHHDGLRLRARVEGDDLRQHIAPVSDVSPLIVAHSRVRIDEPSCRAFVEGVIRDARQAITLAGDLFKVIHITTPHAETSLLCIVAHHLLVDAYAFQVVMNDLLSGCATAVAPRAVLPAKTTSLVEYSIRSTEHWLTRAAEEASYWSNRPWAEVEPVPIDFERRERCNTEQHTVYAIRTLTAEETRAADEWIGADAQAFMTALLAAIAAAYRRWTGQRVLNLAMVFHGREIFAEGIDLSRTVGWISETIPLTLRAALPRPELLDDISVQLVRAGTRGKSYGVLRYLGSRSGRADRLTDLPIPEVSLNVKLSRAGDAAIESAFRREAGYSMGPENIDDTERVFLLSGGVFFVDGRLCVSWDFSRELFDEATIGRYADGCVTELRRAIEERNRAR
jgi:acyl carrier protein